jgi:PAS domain S-box-containing protein
VRDRQIYTACLRDITDRKQADEAVRTSARVFRALFDGALDAMIITDSEGHCLEANPAASALYGLTRDELRSRSLAEFAADDHPGGEALKALGREGPKKGELRLARRDGVVRDVEFAVTADFLPGNHLVVLRDVTERRLLETEFRQAQKMEAVGRLAGGVAHDFNNLLNVIRGYTELVLGSLEPASPQRTRILEVFKATDRAAGLTRQLLAFSRRQILQPKVFDLNGVVADVESMLGRLIGEDIQLVTELESGLGAVRADPGQIEQVLVNLVVNARDALPRGGRIVVATRNVGLDASYPREHPGIPPGAYVLVEVRDDGVGMDPETKRHMFEPFFTTKPVGKGTGLGLAMVYGIVQQSSGHITVETAPEAGTTVRIYFPRVDQPAPAATAAGAGAAPRGVETVLLVEDQPMLRNVTREMLEALGYRVLDAGSGAQALRIAGEHTGRIHLLVTDVVMPGMNGAELAARFLAIRPDARVIYTSGYTDDAILDLTAGADLDAFLQKPYTASALGRKVREVLDAPSRVAP